MRKKQDRHAGMKSALPTGTIDAFSGLLAGRTDKKATIEEMNEAAAAGWASSRVLQYTVSRDRAHLQ
jgi:hypothetical protein